MMKRIFLLLALITCLSQTTKAEEWIVSPNGNNVTASSDEKQFKPRHAPKRLPTLNQEGDYFVLSGISADSHICISFYDENGIILYSQERNSPESTLELTIPSTVAENVYVITFSINNEKYIANI